MTEKIRLLKINDLKIDSGCQIHIVARREIGTISSACPVRSLHILAPIRSLPSWFGSDGLPHFSWPLGIAELISL